MPRSTDASGAIATLNLDVPFDQNLAGAPLFFQAAALEINRPIIPVALSNGRQHAVPPTPSVPGCSRIYEYTLGTSMRAPSSWTGGLIPQFEY